MLSYPMTLSCDNGHFQIANVRSTNVKRQLNQFETIVSLSQVHKHNPIQSCHSQTDRLFCILVSDVGPHRSATTHYHQGTDRLNMVMDLIKEKDRLTNIQVMQIRKLGGIQHKVI